MSVLGEIGKIVEAPVNAVAGAAESVADLAVKVFKGIGRLWGFLTDTAKALDGAWDWVVHGVEWIGLNLDHLAGETFGWAWGIVTHLIPGIAAWVYNNAIGWAWKELEILAASAEHAVAGAIKWAGKEISYVEKVIAHDVKSVTRWAAGAVHWVEHRAGYVWHLLTHPVALAELLAADIVLPIVKFILKSSAPIVVWLLKSALSKGSAAEHLVEDILHDLL